MARSSGAVRRTVGVPVRDPTAQVHALQPVRQPILGPRLSPNSEHPVISSPGPPAPPFGGAAALLLSHTHDVLAVQQDGQTAFALRARPVGSTVVFVNGLYYRPGEYTVTGRTLNFTAHPLEVGDTLDVMYQEKK